MIGSWWLIWAVFLILLVPTLSYGWGYRGWGPPYPSYVQRQRGLRAVAGGGSASFDHHAWGWGGDLVWMVLLVGAFWAAWGFWSR